MAECVFCGLPLESELWCPKCGGRVRHLTPRERRRRRMTTASEVLGKILLAIEIILIMLIILLSNTYPDVDYWPWN